MLTRTVEPTARGEKKLSIACYDVWRGCSRGGCSCMLMRRQYARAARAADQTRACVSAAHRPTRPIEMTKGGGEKKRNSLKCHQSVQSQQSTTNRCGAPATTSTTGEPGRSRARRKVWQNRTPTETSNPEHTCKIKTISGFSLTIIFFFFQSLRFYICP